MGLREIGKNRRRARILEAARTCLRTEGASGLSTKAIAERAEVSVATLYNLFGSREGIITSLLAISIHELASRFDPGATGGSGVEGALENGAESLAEIAITEFTSNAFYYRELIRSVEQLESRAHLDGIIKLGVDLGEPVLERMIERGDLLAVVSPRVLSHQLFMSFVHALRLWASELTTTERFRTHYAHSQALTLAAVANEPLRSVLHRRLAELDAEMLAFSEHLRSEPDEPHEPSSRAQGA